MSESSTIRIFFGNGVQRDVATFPTLPIFSRTRMALVSIFLGELVNFLVSPAELSAANKPIQIKESESHGYRGLGRIESSLKPSSLAPCFQTANRLSE